MWPWEEGRLGRGGRGCGCGLRSRSPASCWRVWCGYVRVSMSITCCLFATAGLVCEWRIREREVEVFGGLIDGTSQLATAAGDYSDEAHSEALAAKVRQTPDKQRRGAEARRRRELKKHQIVFTNLSHHHTTFSPQHYEPTWRITKPLRKSSLSLTGHNALPGSLSWKSARERLQRQRRRNRALDWTKITRKSQEKS